MRQTITAGLSGIGRSLRGFWRTYRVLGPALCAFLLVSSAAVAASPIVMTADGGGFDIPAAAYGRPFGGPIPKVRTCDGPTRQRYPIDCGTPGSAVGPPTQAGLGIPLGGIGAGSFMINQTGTFGPWNFGNQSLYENRILPQAAFHVRSQLSGEPASTTTLAVNGPLGSLPSGWRLLRPGQGTYHALYPFGWITYRGLPIDTSMRFWSPIVARDDEDSSMPVAFFDVQVANPANRSARVSVMFTFPNAAEHGGAAYTDGSFDATAYLGPRTIREGLTSGYRSDARTGVSGVTVGSDAAANTPDAAHSQWTVAARPASGQQVSWTTSWNANSDGGDVYRAFSADGSLPDRPLDGSHSAAALAVRVALAPGERQTIHFALAWDFPQVSFGKSNETVWMRRYTAFFGGREDARNNYLAGSYPFHQGFAIADRMLAEETGLLRAVRAWWGPLATDPAYPVWLRTAALNEISYLAWGTSFWESGLVANSAALTAGGPRIGSQIPGTHLFYDFEGGGYPDANCWDCYAYGYRMTQQLFPDLARDLLRGWTAMVMQDPTGGTPHDAGGADPWIQWRATSPPAIGNVGYADEPAKYIAVAYAYWRATKDPAFLRFAYPAMVKTLRFIQAHILPGDRLPLVAPLAADTYDAFPVIVHDVYTAQLYLLAEQAVIAATQQARAIGGIPQANAADLRTMQDDLVAAKAQFERSFWDSAHGYYRIDVGASNDSDGVMADQLFAEQFAQTLGLPDLVPAEHIVSALAHAFPLLTQFTQDGRPLGAANAVDNAGHEIATTFDEPDEIWVGVNYFLAGTLYTDGKRFRDPRLARDALELGHAMYDQIYTNVGNGFAFSTPEAWTVATTAAYRNPTYSRVRAVWELFAAVKQPQIPAPQRK